MNRHTAMALLLALSACGPVAENAQYSADDVNTMKNDTREAWYNAFAYTPRKKTQLPQTRYCYKTQADIVCYDSPQSQTAKLVGYQDGASISWVQPGGGSLGVSGGEPTAPQDAQIVQIAPSISGSAAVVNTGTDIDTSAPVTDVSSTALPGSTPFQSNESSYVKKP